MQLFFKTRRASSTGARAVCSQKATPLKKGRPLPGAPFTTLFFDSVSMSCVYPDPVEVVNFPSYFAICTRSLFPGATTGMGCSVCGERQLSRIPTCCTQLTVQRGAHPLCVEYSRWRLSAVYCARGIPG